MLYHSANLTQMIVTMTSTAQMLAFLNDRERSVQPKMRKAIATRLGDTLKGGAEGSDTSATPFTDADALIEEIRLIHALRKSLKGDT